MTECDLIPALSTEKPHLSDAIHYPTDIAPYPFVCLWAGVGAGKNTFIEKFISGDPKEEIPRLTILLITSRKAKVLETLRKYPKNTFGKLYDENNYYEILQETSLSTEEYEYTITIDELDYTITQRSAIYTNAAIEKYLQYCHNPIDPCTHLWNRFDLIIWDEVHSLIMDSSYQSSPYHVMHLFQQTYKKMHQASEGKIEPPRCKHLIMMTGTPEPIADITMIKNAHTLDLREVCCHVVPHNIHFLTQRQAQQQIRQQLQSGERIVYFCNHVPSVDDLKKEYQISNERIAISFSDKTRRKEQKKRFKEEEKRSKKKEKDNSVPEEENDYTRMLRVEEHLTTKASIPSDIDLFVTTSRNKEGIDIEDTDIHHIYVESHSLTDIRQMAGRIRCGAEHLYIILDARGYENSDGPYEHYLSQQVTNEKITANGPEESQLNLNLRKFCQWQKIHNLPSIRTYDDAHPQLGLYIDQVKKKYPHVEFDYFLNRFQLNPYRQNSKDYYASEIQMFNDVINDPVQLVSLFQTAFPESVIHGHIPPEDQARTLGWDFFYSHPNGNFSQAEFDELISKLDELLTSPQDRKRRKSAKPFPNRLLHKIGLDYSPRNNNTRSSGYSEYLLTPYKKKDSEAA